MVVCDFVRGHGPPVLPKVSLTEFTLGILSEKLIRMRNTSHEKTNNGVRTKMRKIFWNLFHGNAGKTTKI